MIPATSIVQPQGSGSNSDHQCEMIQQYSTSICKQEETETEVANLPDREKITKTITAVLMDTIHVNRTRQAHAQVKYFYTRSRIHKVTQWGYHRTTRHAYGRKY